LDVTANPGGAETLQIVLRVLDPVSGDQIAYAQATADAFGGGTGNQLLVVGPGAATTPISGFGSVSAELPIPRIFLTRIIHSAAGSWTYSVSYTLIN